eukprot:1161840-Pelagomonas_calceolata.AAC.19
MIASIVLFIISRYKSRNTMRSKVSQTFTNYMQQGRKKAGEEGRPFLQQGKLDSTYERSWNAGYCTSVKAYTAPKLFLINNL